MRAFCEVPPRSSKVLKGQTKSKTKKLQTAPIWRKSFGCVRWGPRDFQPHCNYINIFNSCFAFTCRDPVLTWSYPPRFVWGNAESQCRLPVCTRVPGREDWWFILVCFRVQQLLLLVQDLANQIYWWENFSKACRQNKIRKGTKLNPEVAEFLSGISAELGAV